MVAAEKGEREEEDDYDNEEDEMKSRVP